MGLGLGARLDEGWIFFYSWMVRDGTLGTQGPVLDFASTMNMTTKSHPPTCESPKCFSPDSARKTFPLATNSPICLHFVLGEGVLVNTNICLTN